MTTLPVGTPPDGAEDHAVPGVVIGAAALLALGVVPALLVLPHDRVALDVNLPLLGWLPVGIAGVLLLDREPRSRLGWVAVVTAALTPVAMMLAALPEAAPATSIGPGWLVPVLTLAVAALPAPSRSSRRWRTWIAGWCLVTLGAGTLAWLVGAGTAYGVTTTLGLLGLASTLVASILGGEPRPVLEPLVDAGLALGVVLAGALAGGLVWSFAAHERIFGAEVVGAFAAAVTIVMTSPLALALRRSFIARRYGSGVLSPDDLVTLTDGLQAYGDPRRLLGTASDFLVAASGIAEAHILLDDSDSIEDRAGWATYALSVGRDGVGTLSVRSAEPEGLEARQERVVRQLVPTLGLVARAVSLAVEAEHARADVVREREDERARILTDLHDDLGPALAGMGMRLEAVRTSRAGDEHAALAALADDIAGCRADLRRIVSALTPEALVDTDLASALSQLVAGLRTTEGPELVLEVGPLGDEGDVDGDLAVLVYRFVAEGVTNALRHAGASRITVSLTGTDGTLGVSVEDDGRGGPVAAGVGLSSLASRAAEAGGSLACEPRSGGGLRLALDLTREVR